MALTKNLIAAVALALAVQPCLSWEQCDFVGLALPLFYYHGETEWPAFLRLVLYLVGLAWLFLAVGMISDIFMEGIERITALRKRVKKPIPNTDPVEYSYSTVYVWNGTMANLTLMALGSSAPEILLSVIEITTGNFLLGDLGAGTIVGSAAFNLLIISAVCVAAIPDGEIRKIKQVPVYIITATFSVFAYVWLLFMVIINTPQVVTAGEALSTLFFLPLLLVLAFLADKGYITFGLKVEEEEEKTLDVDASKEELAQVYKEIQEKHGSNLTTEQITAIMKIEYLERKNKAYYRNLKKGQKDEMLGNGDIVERPKDTGDEAPNEKKQKTAFIGFENDHYAVLESCTISKFKIVREGCTSNKCSINYATRADTAREDSDFKMKKGTIIFERGETEKFVEVEIVDDNAYEEDEHFWVDLSSPQSLEDICNTSAAIEVKLTDGKDKAKITIIDDDLPGKLRFIQPEMEAVEDEHNDTEYEVEVIRYDGGSGIITCKYKTESLTAVPEVDYEDVSGTLTFEDKVMRQSICVPIKHSGRYARKSSFTVTLSNATGGALFAKDSDGGAESEIGEVVIKGCQSEKREQLLNKMKSRVIATQSANNAYAQQFIDALFKVKDDDDEDEEGGEGDDLKEEGSDKPSKMDWFFHIIGLPWKLLFAFVPPPQYCGGWATFFGALCMIAVVTAVIGDMANLVGCCMGLDPEITAITFVALGTSLPDTFASKTAAECDPYADNSIGNVTGSNSVNVFIGLGLSWSIAAVFWQIQPPNSNWIEKFETYTPSVQGSILEVMGLSASHDHWASGGFGDAFAVFMVPSGSLWFNLMVFSLNAFFALQHLAARRKTWGGELGGPKKGFMGQYFSATFLACQWFIYVIASTIFVYANKP